MSTGNLTPLSRLNSMATWKLCAAGLGVMFFFTFGVVLYKKWSAEPTQTQSAGVDWVNTSSDAMFASSKEEKSDPVIIKKEEPKPDDAPLSAKEAFITPKEDTPVTTSKPKPDYSAFRREQLRLNQARRQESAIAYVGAPDAPHSQKSIENTQPDLTAKDFSEHGIKKDTSTYPVDLSRTITADRYIPCILVDQIHSQLEGMAVCQVEENVYGYHGRNILIPAGSRVIGHHGTLEKVGMERFELEWQRIIRPDGAHILLSSAHASDQIGQTGVTGKVDTRMFDKYGMAMITATFSTLMQAGMSIASEEGDITNSVVENYGTDLGQVTAAMLEDTVNIKPFAVVPSGTRLFIRSETDIWLKETQDGELAFAKADNTASSSDKEKP